MSCSPREVIPLMVSAVFQLPHSICPMDPFQLSAVKSGPKYPSFQTDYSASLSVCHYHLHATFYQTLMLSLTAPKHDSESVLNWYGQGPDRKRACWWLIIGKLWRGMQVSTGAPLNLSLQVSDPIKRRKLVATDAGSWYRPVFSVNFQTRHFLFSNIHVK